MFQLHWKGIILIKPNCRAGVAIISCCFFCLAQHMFHDFGDASKLTTDYLQSWMDCIESEAI